MIDLSKIKKAITPESVVEWYARHKAENDKYNETLNEFHKTVSPEIIENMIKDTDSESAERSFLYDYAKKYGRECDEEEYKQYSNEFTRDIYYIHGYYFHMMSGQGCAVEIIKTSDIFEIEFIETTGMTIAEDIATTKNITNNG